MRKESPFSVKSDKRVYAFRGKEIRERKEKRLFQRLSQEVEIFTEFSSHRSYMRLPRRDTAFPFAMLLMNRSNLFKFLSLCCNDAAVKVPTVKITFGLRFLNESFFIIHLNLHQKHPLNGKFTFPTVWVHCWSLRKKFVLCNGFCLAVFSLGNSRADCWVFKLLEFWIVVYKFIYD